jgi:hypothetical protein
MNSSQILFFASHVIGGREFLHHSAAGLGCVGKRGGVGKLSFRVDSAFSTSSLTLSIGLLSFW